jgi:CRISPR/Cas system CSM-associated protein Csm2 small subunit
MNMVEKTRVEIELMGIELVALKKLALVSHALAQKIGGRAGEEQKCLAGVLDDVIRQIELSAAKAA